MHSRPAKISVGLTNLTISDDLAFAKCKVDRPAAERGQGVSIPFLGTNNQVYCDLLRQKPSAKSGFGRVRLDAFGRNNGGSKTSQQTLAYLF